MKQPTWNAWTAVVVLGLLASGLYLSRIGQFDLGSVCVVGALALAGITERERPGGQS